MTHIVLSKKIIKLRSNCVVLLKTFIQKLYVLNHSPLKYFIQVSTKSSILFSIFIKSCIFFSIYTILNKFESGAIRVDPYCPFLKNDQFLSKAHTYGSNYLVFPNISRNFRSRYHTVLIILSFQELYINFDQKLFFLLQIFLKNTNQE